MVRQYLRCCSSICLLMKPVHSITFAAYISHLPQIVQWVISLCNAKGANVSGLLEPDCFVALSTLPCRRIGALSALR
jgi:hypothetical protein